MKKAYFCTAEELEQRGKDNLPKQFQSGEHLICNVRRLRLPLTLQGQKGSE